MKKISVLSVFGTRPEAIKMAPLVKELDQHPNISSIVCVTGQHRGMLDNVLDFFQIEPDFDLNIMTDGQTLDSVTANIVSKFGGILQETKPDLVLVHGDTTTSFSAALVCFYHQVKLGHVEAGLRTYNKFSPFPEELNRQFITKMADFHFAPTSKARDNLCMEGVDDSSIIVTGNTAIDAFKYTLNKDSAASYEDWIGDSKLILLTTHRRENLGKGMERIFSAMKKILHSYQNYKLIFPVHPNPKIRKTLERVFDGMTERIKLIEPLDVSDFHNLMNRADLIFTDSGGIQEEAPHLNKPVLVLRDTTERPEGVEAGTLKLIGTQEEEIIFNAVELIENQSAYQLMANSKNPYGDGKASERIVDFILKEL